MTDDDLILEVGQDAYDELNDKERAAITAKFTAAQSLMAGMATFKLLMKKFKSDYRMGRTYEALSQKYEFYRKIYFDYANSVSAGKIAKTDMDDDIVLERDKFLSDKGEDIATIEDVTSDED